MTVIDSPAVWDLTYDPHALYGEPPDTEPCPSRIWHASLERFVICAGGHVEQDVVDHRAPLGPGAPLTWTDDDAARMEMVRTWTCLYCDAACDPNLFRGCCTARCARLEHDTADEYEAVDA
jgi:hypothetical protein